MMNRYPSNEETDNDRLSALRGTDILTIDLVSALAGDRPLKKVDAIQIDKSKTRLGNRFYSDILYAITHQNFEPDLAKTLWGDIIKHKYEMSRALKRNVRIVVAALDHLSNITGDIASTTLISEEHIADIVDVSLRDGLTGLFTPAFFYRKTDFEIKRSIRYGTPVSLMMIDVDDFKQINDTYGHQEGDSVLKSLGTAIEATTRETDMPCRYGGEEFAVLLPSTDRVAALALAERLRGAIENELPHKRKISVSIGVAISTASSKLSAHTLVEAADKALYEAKQRGKNRVFAVE